jgi:hypothetical protein
MNLFVDDVTFFLFFFPLFSCVNLICTLWNPMNHVCSSPMYNL